MVLLNEGVIRPIVIGKEYQPGLGRTRLAGQLFSGRFRPGQSVKLREIAVEYELDEESVLKAFAEFQALGMVTFSENFSAVVRSPEPEETQEAYEIWAAIEEIAGRIAATVLKGYTLKLHNELAAMRAAVARGDFEAYARHDVNFHRDIVKASQNDVLLRAWDTLAVDLRIRAAIGKLSKDLPEVVESQRPIVEALERGRGEEAGLLLRNHVETFLKFLRRTESAAPGQDLVWRDGNDGRLYSVAAYRGGLGPARLRRVAQLVHTKIEDELSLNEMAQSVGLSTAHFSHMFRKSTGESPHRFVLRQRIDRAKDLLRAGETRILDVAVACGFKSQQHFARVFRRMCGASPTEYRREFLCQGAT
jgi:DNA-binding GntR family transcriptional regulator/AraC-like DNA-binding protein